LLVRFGVWLVGSRHSPWTALLLKIGLRGCLETSAPNYLSTLRKIPNERSSRWHRVGRLKSRISNKV
jgi:hypothetical protein